ncbi:high mobility group box domain-containing protein, partial [Mycena rebaudengoi]
PLSPYLFFCNDWRESIQAENPDADFGEVGKLLGAKWKEFDGEQRKPYIEQAAKDKARAEGRERRMRFVLSFVS